MKSLTKTTLITLLLNTLMLTSSHANEQANVCAACHGANGISSDPNVPNLAGQHKKYLTSQLNAFKSKNRKNAIMNAIAAKLTDDEIDSLSTFFNEQSTVPSTTDTSSEDNALSALLKNNPLAFPDNFPTGYSQYLTKNRADNKQVRYLYLDTPSMKTFKNDGVLPTNSSLIMEVYKAKLNDAGEPVEGSDGFYEKGKLAAYGVMVKESDWGDKMPKEIRNGDWKYGFFKPTKEHHPTRNMAKCMACHKPLSEQEYMFSFDGLNNHSQAMIK